MGMSVGGRQIVAFRVASPAADLLYPGPETLPAEDLYPTDPSVPITRMQLGTEIIWDGRLSVNISAPPMQAVGDVPEPAVRANAVVAVSQPARGYGETVTPPPTIRAGALVSSPSAAAQADMPTPEIVTDNFIEAPPMTVFGFMPPPEAASAVGAVIFADTAEGTGTMEIPAVAGDVTITPPPMALFASEPAPTWAVHGAVAPPVMGPVTAAMPAPELVIIEFEPKGGQRTAAQTLTGSYAKVPLTSAMATYPTTVLVSGGIQVNYTGTVHLVLDCVTSGAASGYQQIFLPYVNDVATELTPGAGIRGTRHHAWDLNVTAGDVVSIYAYRTGTSSVTADPFTLVISLPA